MALVIEDGTGKATADSYISEADADTYHTNYTGSADWSGASSATKEAALRQATLYLDTTYQGRWRGTRTNETQALAWPREGWYDDDQFAVDDDAMPVNLGRATAEIALRIVIGDDLLAVVTEPGDVIEESVGAGPAKETIKYAGPKPFGYQYPKVEALLAGLLAPISMIRA